MDASKLIKDKTFMKLGKKTTVCLLTLDNGFEIVGTSACINPSSYDYAMGKKIAEEDAMYKYGQIVGFIFTEALHLEQLKQQEDEVK